MLSEPEAKQVAHDEDEANDEASSIEGTAEQAQDAAEVVYAPLSKTHLPSTKLKHPLPGSLPSWLNDDQQSVASTRRSRVAESVASTRRSRVAESMISVATSSTERARELAMQRKEIQRRTDEALKRQKMAAEAKARLAEQTRYQSYEIGLCEWEKACIINDDDTLSPLRSEIMAPLSPLKPDKTLGSNIGSNRPYIPKLATAAGALSSRLWNYTPRSVGTPRSGFILSSARYIASSRSEKEEKKQRKLVEKAFKNVKAANDGVLKEHRKLRNAAAASRERAFLAQQTSHRERQLEIKHSARIQRKEQAEVVRQDAEYRKRKEVEVASARRRTAIDRLQRQAKQRAEEVAHEQQERQAKKATQARYTEARTRKEARAEQKAKEEQKEIEQERNRDKAEARRFEEARAKREAEWDAQSRRAKREAYEEAARKDAAEKAKAAEIVRARFKASQEERTKREAEKLRAERAEARKLREVQRRKVEEEHRAKKAEARQKAKELKEALREAAAMQYEADERGKMRRKADPTKELEKKMRKLEEESAMRQRERDAELAAKEAAFIKAAKEAEFQRRLQVEKAQREVAATFKKNQEKELRDRLAREKAEKERFARIAKEMKEKIEQENIRRLEAERQAALNLKEMKAAQYEADLAAHKRRERMEQLKAKQARHLQEVAWKDVMEWREREIEEDQEKREENKDLFTQQRAVRKADEEELQEVRLFYESKMKLEMEEKRAKRETAEAARFEAVLKQTADVARTVAAEVKSLRDAKLGIATPVDPNGKQPGGSLFGILPNFSLTLPAFTWGHKKQVDFEQVRV